MTRAQKILALELFGSYNTPLVDCATTSGISAPYADCLTSQVWTVYRETHPIRSGDSWGGWVHATIQLAALELAQRIREGSE